MQQQQVRYAVLPVAGLGTRFLPVTKTVPKELLPIGDKPALLLAVEELLHADIHNIVLVTGRGKTAIEDFFDCSYELESTLEKTGKLNWLDHIIQLRSKINVISIRQKQALGLGHALATAAPIVQHENAFAVSLCDEVFLTEKNQPNVVEQLLAVHQSTQISAVSVLEVPTSEVVNYGMIQIKEKTREGMRIQAVIEKPSVETSPSQWALPGRYIFTTEIFEHLRQTKPGRLGEVQLTDAMSSLAATQGIIAVPTMHKRFDTGQKLGYLQANIEFTLQHPEMGKALRAYLKELL